MTRAEWEAHLLAQMRAAKPARRVPEPCPYFGEATGDSVECQTCSGRVSLKLFSCGLHRSCTPAKRVDGVACCKGCPDRPREQPRLDPWSRPVRIPEPPALDLTSRVRAVVTVATGKAGADLLAISGPLMQAYAKRLAADFVVLDWPGIPEYPIAGKFQLARVLEHYDRVVFLDADVLVPPTALDLFVAVGPDEFGIYDDLPEILAKGAKFIDEYQRIRETQGLKRSPVRFYGNTGVMVLSRQHLGALAVPPRPVPIVHCTEQHWIIARLHDLAVKMRMLPKVANWQWWPGKSLEGAPPDAILHFSGMQGRAPAERLRLMRQHAERLQGVPVAPGGGLGVRAGDRPTAATGGAA